MSYVCIVHQLYTMHVHLWLNLHSRTHTCGEYSVVLTDDCWFSLVAFCVFLLQPLLKEFCVLLCVYILTAVSLAAQHHSQVID